MADENGTSERELNAILDRLLSGKAPEEIMGQGGLVKDLTRRLVERVLELGLIGEGYLTELIHARPHTWKGNVERLFALLEELGDEPFLRLLQRALFQRLWGAEYVVGLAAREVAS